MKWTTEAKVGLFTVIGIVLFAMCIIFLGRIELFQPPQMHITGEFKSVTDSSRAIKLSIPVCPSGASRT